jgi:hypothetical protein
MPISKTNKPEVAAKSSALPKIPNEPLGIPIRRTKVAGMLRGVDPVGHPGWIGCLATSSLSNPIRMSTGHNLLALHR